MNIPAYQFGQDHWQLLSIIYTKTREVGEPLAKLDKKQLRCNPAIHPQHNANHIKWQEKWGTRICASSEQTKNLSPEQLIQLGFIKPEHDDWLCLNELEKEGLIQVMSTSQALIKITEKGQTIAQQIQHHTLCDGQYHNFKPTP
jgi:hypothetical protein